MVRKKKNRSCPRKQEAENNSDVQQVGTEDELPVFRNDGLKPIRDEIDFPEPPSLKEDVDSE